MLVVQVQIGEDEERMFVPMKFEHSLFTISKWEEKWHISFFNDADKTEDQILDYIRCMVVDESDLAYLDYLTPANVEEILDYIADPATATKVYSRNQNGVMRRKSTTSEVLYFQMFSRQIPMECQHWHINRLIALIQVWDVYNADPKSNKMSKKQTRDWYIQENARRRAQMHSKG